MATLDTRTPPTALVATSPPSTTRTRAVATAVCLAAAAAWFRALGVPADPVSIFIWLWLVTIAWRWGVPLRRHLDFARDWWPALATLLFYTYTRGLADGLGIEPHVTMPITVDRWIGGGELPTQRLQAWWCGSTCGDRFAGRWYDTFFTATYVTHFVGGLTIAAVLWLSSREVWVRWMRRYLALNLAGLSVYVVYPMVPPWMASDSGAFTPEVHRMSGRGGAALGIKLEELVMGPIGNPVAAMPSLHAGTAFLIAFFGISALTSTWRWLLLVYPLTMTTALVYFGEHYVVDAVAGAVLAGIVMTACRLWERRPGRTRPADTSDHPVEQAA